MLCFNKGHLFEYISFLWHFIKAVLVCYQLGTCYTDNLWIMLRVILIKKQAEGTSVEHSEDGFYLFVAEDGFILVCSSSPWVSINLILLNVFFDSFPKFYFKFKILILIIFGLLSMVFGSAYIASKCQL